MLTATHLKTKCKVTVPEIENNGNVMLLLFGVGSKWRERGNGAVATILCILSGAPR